MPGYVRRDTGQEFRQALYFVVGVIETRNQRRHRVRIAQRLRGNPILAIAAMEIASQHAKAERQPSRTRVEKRFLLYGIALNAAYVAPGDHEPAALVEAHLAYAESSIRNRAAMPACVTTHALPVELVVKLPFGGQGLKDFFQTRHRLLPQPPGGSFILA